MSYLPLNINQMQKKWGLIIAFIALLSTIYLIKTLNSKVTQLPDFGSITNVTEKKQAFFNYLRPYIEQQNQAILEQRDFLKQVQSSLNQASSLSKADQSRLNKIARQYRFTTDDWDPQQVGQLLSQVDIIPVRLVLVQAANESGWGTSRFAKQANNLFGQWCFTQGCGVVPTKRSAGMTHEVAKFDSVGDSVGSYVNNLNSNQAYSRFRELRASLRAQSLTPTAEQLIHGLGNYSERKDDYINDILNMLRQNEALLANS
jgi:Bax protein